MKLTLIIKLLALLLVLTACTSQKNESSASAQSSTMGKEANMAGADVPVKSATKTQVVQDDSGKTVLYWYDPMVPTQHFEKPGKSPFMDMQLEPKYAENGDNGASQGVYISAQTMQNLGIRLEKVVNRGFGNALTAVGRITPDQQRYFAVQTRIPGFVERLYVRAEGDPVKKGQKIAEVYAPELLAAEQEYLTLLTLNEVDKDHTLKQAARTRLKLMGMAEAEISAITNSGKANSRFGVYAPATGVVTELNIREGAATMSGTALMQIADLSQVWVLAEINERDAQRIKPGTMAKVQLQSFPDQPFTGKVDYIYPNLDSASRTLQARIALSNKTGALKPGMYANVIFNGDTHEAVSVSTESIIATGTRKVVIVKTDHNYRPAEVVAGQSEGQYTEILSGLSLGENVVSSGQFLVDSEASLSGVLDRLSLQSGETAGHDMSTHEHTQAEPRAMP